MIEVLVRDACESPIGKVPSSRFCYEKMRFCYETPTVKRLPNEVAQVSVCLFETTDEILGAIGKKLQTYEQIEFARIWADDDYPRTYERKGDVLLIRGQRHLTAVPDPEKHGSLR